MTISIWRYSHLALAVSSFAFIALAAITGIILSFKPINEKAQLHRVEHFDQISLSEVIPNLKKSYADISELTVDANQFVAVNGTDLHGESGIFYIDPRTGRKLGDVAKENKFFQWMITLHRSLFLHETGRVFVGLTALFLFLIAVSGMVLIIQRQRSFKRFFGKIVRDNFAQYYHVFLGRLLLIPILIIAISGTYLSMSRFGIISEIKISHQVDFDSLRSKPHKDLADFEVFTNTMLSEVQSIEFPFSTDVEDYYTLKLKDREQTINQLTGDVLTDIPYPMSTLLTNLSMDLHTGRTSALWAIVLAIATANILFFIYSGFVMTLKRRASRIKNKFKAEESEFIILVGSENGSTFYFANAIHEQLLKNGCSSFIAELNDYKVFPEAKQLLVFTATYGIGNAPTNAVKFAALLAKFPQQNTINFSVVGFGSHAYPDFCKFAHEANNLLAQQSWAAPLLEIQTVNDRSPDEFARWAHNFSQKIGKPVTILSHLIGQKQGKTKTFTVVDRILDIEGENAFLIRLNPVKRSAFTSGDLLSIYPANDHRERLYSVGKIGRDVQLSVKLHAEGLGSGYLHRLEVGQRIEASIVSNKDFHFPGKPGVVIMISNGTGIAPFLGMIDQNKKGNDCHLYCGFRSSAGFELYKQMMARHIEAKKLTQLHVAYSREGEKQYVKDLLLRDATFIGDSLKNGGVIMICGSLAMQTDVVELLETICGQKANKSVSFYQSRNQIRMDCY